LIFTEQSPSVSPIRQQMEEDDYYYSMRKELVVFFHTPSIFEIVSIFQKTSETSNVQITHIYF